MATQTTTLTQMADEIALLCGNGLEARRASRRLAVEMGHLRAARFIFALVARSEYLQRRPTPMFWAGVARA